MKLAYLALCAPLAACSTNPNGIEVALAPEVISSLDGTTHVTGQVFANKDTLEKKPVSITVDYTDRNGTTHAIDPQTTTTDVRGNFEIDINGLTWDGSGTITATVLTSPTGSPVMVGGAPLDGTATFAVLDRTPPKVTIMAPPTVHASTQNATLTAMVTATDEIGVSEVDFQRSDFNGGGGGFNGGGRTSVIASGATSVTESFTMDIQQTNAGATFTLYALAVDLSGNIGTATPVTVTVN